MDVKVSVRLKGYRGEIELIFEHERGGLPAEQTMEKTIEKALALYEKIGA